MDSPLTLGNTASKVAASAANKPLAALMPKVTLENQRGLIAGRHILDNILELESDGLKQAACSPSQLGTSSFDIEAAFPSLDHGFMWRTLAAYMVPMPILNLIRSLCHNHMVLFKVFGMVHPGFAVSCCIKQG